MKYFPFGELKPDRYELSKRYRLVELVNGVHRLTEKCKRNYNQLSYIGYLQGNLERPIRISPIKSVKKKERPTVKVKADPYEYKNPECQQIISEILSL